MTLTQMIVASKSELDNRNIDAVLLNFSWVSSLLLNKVSMVLSQYGDPLDLPLVLESVLIAMYADDSTAYCMLLNHQ